MPITFCNIRVGDSYSRKKSSSMWGYSSFHAIARGVVTPKGGNEVVLFFAEDKQEEAEQYADRLNGGTLEWEGPTDHFAEERMIEAANSGEEIHLFHRDRHHTDFVYIGMLKMTAHTLNAGKPSRFKFEVI
jgi:hypothetical protein